MHWSLWWANSFGQRKFPTVQLNLTPVLENIIITKRKLCIFCSLILSISWQNSSEAYHQTIYFICTCKWFPLSSGLKHLRKLLPYCGGFSLETKTTWGEIVIIFVTKYPLPRNHLIQSIFVEGPTSCWPNNVLSIHWFFFLLMTEFYSNRTPKFLRKL